MRVFHISMRSVGETSRSRFLPVGETSWSQCSLFRSFRSLMSIEIRVITLSRSFRSLIEKQRSVSKFIKDLKDLKSFRIAAAIDMQDLKDLKRRYFHRSARACPSRSVPVGETSWSRCSSVVCDRLITNRSGSGDLDLQGLTRERSRGTGPRPTVTSGCLQIARDRPSRYGESAPLVEREGQALALRAGRRLFRINTPSPYQ